MDYLDEIIAYKRQNRPNLDQHQLERDVDAAPEVRSFLDYLGTYRTVVIAECKKASPSRGLLSPEYDPVRLAQTYENAGAFAVSVLTDEKFFQGSMSDLSAVRAAIDLPVLRKDFTLEEPDLLEARASGADMVLLIARILDQKTLSQLFKTASQLGMDVIVEVHDEGDVQNALEAGSRLIGINNRNLVDFTVDLALTEKLIAGIPSQVAVVSESGIFSGDDVARLREMGTRAVLVGEALLRAPDTAALLAEMVMAGCPDCWPNKLVTAAQPKRASV